MKAWIRHTAFAALAIGFVTGMCFLGHAERMSRKNLFCKRLVVEFSDSLRFVNEDDVAALLRAGSFRYEEEPIDSLHLDLMENLLRSNPAITDCQAWTTDDGDLHIRLAQREPVVRFMNGDKGFYADRNGFLFPLYSRFEAKAPVVHGPLPTDSLWIAKMIELAEFLTVSGQEPADSIAVDSKGCLTVRFGTPELFKFGQPENFPEKFRKISDYFNYIKSPDKKYKTVDLTYSKQIICR